MSLATCNMRPISMSNPRKCSRCEDSQLAFKKDSLQGSSRNSGGGGEAGDSSGSMLASRREALKQRCNKTKPARVPAAFSGISQRIHFNPGSPSKTEQSARKHNKQVSHTPIVDGQNPPPPRIDNPGSVGINVPTGANNIFNINRILAGSSTIGGCLFGLPFNRPCAHPPNTNKLKSQDLDPAKHHQRSASLLVRGGLDWRFRKVASHLPPSRAIQTTSTRVPSGCHGPGCS